MTGGMYEQHQVRQRSLLDSLDEAEISQTYGTRLEDRLEPTNFSSGPGLLSTPATMEKVSPSKASHPKVKRTVSSKLPGNANSKETRMLRSELNTATKRAEAAEEKVAEFREKLKNMRAALSTKDKQLSTARKSVEHLGGERDNLQSALQTDKEHSRKLEVKLTSQKGLAEMTMQWKNSKAKIKTMEDTVMEAESRLMAAEEVQRQQKAEINTLRMALDVKARELSSMGGQEISSRLLYAVAKSREEGVAMAVQAAEQREAVTTIQTELSKAEFEIRRLEDENEDLQRQKEQLEACVIQAKAEARHAHATSEATASEIEAAAERYRKLEDERDKHLEALRERKARVEELKDSLQQEQAESRRQADSAREDMVAALNDLTKAATLQKDELREQIFQMREEHQQAKLAWVQEKADLQRKLGHAEAQGQIHMSKATELEAEVKMGRDDLEQEMSNLHSEIDAITEVNHRLQSNLQLTQRKLEDEERGGRSLRDQLRRLQHELEETRKAVEASSQSKYNILLQELCKVQDERDQVLAEIQGALQETSDANAAKEAAEREAQRLREMNEDLSSSKADMQKTLLGQMAGVQSTVKDLEKENKQLRDWHPLPTVNGTLPEDAGWHMDWREYGSDEPSRLPTVGRPSSLGYPEDLFEEPGPASTTEHCTTSRLTRIEPPDLLKNIEPGPYPTLGNSYPGYTVPDHFEDSEPYNTATTHRSAVSAYTSAARQSSGKPRGGSAVGTTGSAMSLTPPQATVGPSAYAQGKSSYMTGGSQGRSIGLSLQSPPDSPTGDTRKALSLSQLASMDPGGF